MRIINYWFGLVGVIKFGRGAADHDVRDGIGVFLLILGSWRLFEEERAHELATVYLFSHSNCGLGGYQEGFAEGQVIGLRVFEARLAKGNRTMDETMG